jgi:hypothetical protein
MEVSGQLHAAMDLREIGWKVLDWMHLAQDRNLFYKMRGISCLAEWLLASQEELSSMELVS